MGPCPGCFSCLIKDGWHLLFSNSFRTSFCGVFRMNSYIWCYLWALPISWELVDPTQTLNMDDLYSIIFSNPSTFVCPTNTSGHVSYRLVHLFSWSTSPSSLNNHPEKWTHSPMDSSALSPGTWRAALWVCSHQLLGRHIPTDISRSVT